MKKLLIFFTLLLAVGFNAHAQAVQWAILQDICPPTNWGGAREPHIVSDGDDLISVGSITNSLTLGGQTMNGFNGSNYLAKHDQNGNLLWAKHLIGALSYSKATVDNNKNIVVAGYYYDSLFIDNLIFSNPGQNGGLFITKFSPSGNLIWARTSNQSTNGYIVDPIPSTDGNGNIYIAGGYYHNFSVGPTTINSLGIDDVFLLKYDPNGNFQWLNSFGTVGADRDPSIIGGLGNNVYLAYSSRIQGYTQLAGPNGYYLKKITSTGTEQWSKFVSRRLVYYPANLSRDASDNVYMAGMQDSTLTFDNHTINFTGTDNKTFLAKVNSSGTWKWAKQIPYSQTSSSLSYVNLASEKKNELNMIRYSYSWSTSSGNFQIAKLDTSGTIIKSNNFTTGLPGTTVQTNFYFFNYSSSDNAGNTYLSGGVAGNNVLGSVNLNAPPAILGPALANPSAGFIAKILDNANTVTGTLFIDLNGNGIKDINEQPFENGIVEFTPGPGYVNSAANGNYLMHLTSGNFNLQVAQPANHYTFSPQNHSVTFSGLGQTQTKDFALQPIPNRNDVKVTVTNLTPARPGFRLKYRITFENVGTTTLSDSLQLNYAAGSLTFDSASIAPLTQQTGKLRWFYQNLQPTQKRDIDVNFTVASTTPLNTNLTSIATIKPISTDFISKNNQDTLRQIVTGSFDPNDKQVSHSWLTPQQVTDGQLLDYVIRFQNTGTDTAFTVIVRDSISDKLHMPTFELLSASHPYTFRLLENGMAEWRFDNILLPDSNRNEPASHGFIRYRMKPKSNLVVGDEIKSRAAIYFDYNAPVYTNYATTRISLTNGIKERSTNIQAFRLYPNPAKNYVIVAAEFKKNTSATVSLVNLLGQTLSKITLPANNQIHFQMPLNELPKGVYLIRLETETGMQTQRLVIQ